MCMRVVDSTYGEMERRSGRLLKLLQRLQNIAISCNPGNEALISVIERSWPAIRITLNLLPESSRQTPLSLRQRIQVALYELSERNVKDLGKELTQAVVQVLDNNWRKEVSQTIDDVVKVSDGLHAES